MCQTLNVTLNAAGEGKKSQPKASNGLNALAMQWGLDCALM